VSPPPSRSTIYRVLVRHGLVPARKRKRRRQDYKRWQRDEPMQLWQMDVIGSVFLADGTELKLVSGLDDGSRFCVIATVVRRAAGRAVCRAFVAAMRLYGIPDELLTDSGKVERWHQTLQTGFLTGAGPFATIEDAQAGVDAWRHEYNHDRPHQSLGMATPASRFRPRPPEPDDALSLRHPLIWNCSPARHQRPIAQSPLQSPPAGRTQSRWTGWSRPAGT
jgi:transposase InsO family protein